MSKTDLINLGLENMVLRDRIVGLVRPDTAPIRRLINNFKEAENKEVVDVTRGRKTRSVVITDANYIRLSPVRTKTLSDRLMGKDE